MNFLEQIKANNNINLNPQQEKAVLKVNGATLLLAVPGSGKTTVIVSRIANMIFTHNIDPDQILTLTFSKASAKDMNERYTRFFGENLNKQPKFSTIHSFCYEVIRTYEQINNSKSFKIISDNTKRIKNIYFMLYEQYVTDELLTEIIQKITYCKNMMYKSEQIKNEKISSQNFYEIFNEYEKSKSINQEMDYDDMLDYALKIFNKYPDILSKYQDKYKYLNIDEAQDTSFIQHKIIHLLSSKSGNIFMVGDEDQSIYQFRAAYPKALLNFKKVYPNADVLYLEQNYRSTKKIIEAANHFIKQNVNRHQKNMFTINETGAELKNYKINDLKEQYKFIIQLLNQKETSNTTAIIYRNNDTALPVVDILETSNIEFNIKEQSLTFFNHFVINDILHFINLALDITDIKSFEKIYYKTNLFLKKDAIDFLKKSKKNNVFSTLLTFNKLNGYNIQKIKEAKSFFLDLNRFSPLQVLEFIEKDFGYFEYLRNLNYSSAVLQQKLDILKSIATNVKSLEDFIARISKLKNIIENSSNNKSSITLTTLHSSKGLEFDNVILIDMIDGLFPTYESIKEKDDDKNDELYEEETRLFYVGITRAKKNIEFITSDFAFNRSIKTSRFVNYVFKVPQKINTNISTTKSPSKIEEISDTLREELELYKMGILIKHVHIGMGRIINLDSESIVVDFDAKGTMRLGLKFCVEKKIISICK